MNGINFKKKFGQNFLTDKNLLKSIVRDADVNGDDVVLEIGAGAGALTEELAKECKRVVAFEIDEELQPLLEEKFNGVDNVEIVFKDFLSVDENSIDFLGGGYKVVANLPYYITSPIITKLFSFKNRPSEIVVMVQKEVGQRMVATEKNGDYGYFSALIQANSDAKITRQVNRKLFTPVPNVDSCVVKLVLKDNPYESEFFEFLKECFKMKRKTLVNNLEKYGKENIQTILKSLNLSLGVRADGLGVQTLYEIYKQTKNL